MRGDENVAREEGFEVYEGEYEGGCVEDLPLCLSLGVCCVFFGGFGGLVGASRYEWESYLGGYGEGPEFDELVCEGCHFLVLGRLLFARSGVQYCIADAILDSSVLLKSELRRVELLLSFRRHMSELATTMLPATHRQQHT
jgi:hypothetical protein